jgi:hypothetical protein
MFLALSVLLLVACTANSQQAWSRTLAPSKVFSLSCNETEIIWHYFALLAVVEA